MSSSVRYGLLVLVTSAPTWAADTNNLQLLRDAQKKTLTYAQLTVFDSVHLNVDNGVVTLSGWVTMPYKSSDLAKRVASLGWHIQINTGLPVVQAIAPTVAHLQVPVVFDHMANLDASKGVSQPGFGAFVELDEGIEGLIHVSEFDDSYGGEKIELEVGKSYQMKIIKLSPADHKIGLSIRALKSDEFRADWESYQENEGSGNATLGDHFRNR